MTRVLISAGDASGDLHAAELVEKLRILEPQLDAFGLGGIEMEKSGVEILVHQRELAVGGLVEVLGSLGRIFAAWKKLRTALETRNPDLVILVDSPDLNLPFARRARRAGVPILYYIPPQVWAWRKGRIRKLAQRVDRLAVIFPFEPEVFAGSGLPVDFVGHPLVDRLRAFAGRADRDAARRELALDPDRPLLLILPGSRTNELRHALALHLDTARELHRRDPRIAFALAVAPTLDPRTVEKAVAAAELPSSLRLDLVVGSTLTAIAACDVALAKPGTITLEVAMLGRPLVVIHRAHPLSAAIARHLIELRIFSMPNLLAGERLVPEFVQDRIEPERIADAVAELFEGSARSTQLARLREVSEQLPGGAAERTAAIALEMVRGTARP